MESSEAEGGGVALDELRSMVESYVSTNRGKWFRADAATAFVYQQVIERLQPDEVASVREGAAARGRTAPSPIAMKARRDELMDPRKIEGMVRYFLRRMAFEGRIDCRLFLGGFAFSTKDGDPRSREWIPPTSYLRLVEGSSLADLDEE